MFRQLLIALLYATQTYRVPALCSIASSLLFYADWWLQAQVEKVLTSWKREKIFPPAIVDQCAVNAGVTLTQAVPSDLQSGGAGTPMDTMPSVGNNGDANEINIPSPAMSLFSEPSAGSVDLAALEESFPPKTVASANMEAPR